MNQIQQLINQMCPNGVEWKTLGEVAKLERGVVISKEYLRDNAGDYPVYSSQTENNGEFGKINTYRYNGAYVTWTTDGAYAGTVFRRYGKFNITNVCGLINILDKDSIDVNYLYYILSITTKKYVNEGMGNPKLM
ncbi:MAG: restriction endonuclease subunit S, partial [Bacteroidales bacterium]|nr:restriction endonuclease subunit S [Bacteroidales bacterium]